jgi:cytoskeleton protein RodZ
MDESAVPDPALFPERVGDRLRAAREKAGIDLSDIATRTRIPLRHLSAIEAGNYAALPAQTYCIGFVKSYARAVGADEVELTRDLRAELGLESHDKASSHVDYDAADPARVPSKLLAWTGVGLALLLALGYVLFTRGYFGGNPDTPIAAVEETEDPLVANTSGNTVAGAPVAATTGQVVLTTTDKVWLRIYDKNNKVLIQKEMAAGETFAIPEGTDTPMIRTRLPHLIKITVGGKEVAPLGTAEKLIKDVGLSAAALAARPAISPQPGAATSTQP